MKNIHSKWFVFRRKIFNLKLVETLDGRLAYQFAKKFYNLLLARN